MMKIKKICIASLVCASIPIHSAHAQSDGIVEAPINPLPSLYELSANRDRGDFNLDVPPPINPLPRKENTDTSLFTRSETTTSESPSSTRRNRSPNESSSRRTSTRNSVSEDSNKNTSTRNSNEKSNNDYSLDDKDSD